MIVDNIKYAEKYFGINERFKEIFAILASLNKDTPLGWQEYDGFKISVSECETFDKDTEGNNRPFEAHRKFADIHYVISENEGIGYANIDTLEAITEYDEQNDYLLLCGEINRLNLRQGDFCIVYPEDAHIPQMTAGENKHLKKAVVKFKI